MYNPFFAVWVKLGFKWFHTEKQQTFHKKLSFLETRYIVSFFFFFYLKKIKTCDACQRHKINVRKSQNAQRGISEFIGLQIKPFFPLIYEEHSIFSLKKICETPDCNATFYTLYPINSFRFYLPGNCFKRAFICIVIRTLYKQTSLKHIPNIKKIEVWFLGVKAHWGF